MSSTENGDIGLTATEVADLLGVKRQTVYAYVSRGILHRHMASDGRTSLFDRNEVEQLRLGRRPEREGEMRTMLATRLTRVADDGLLVRGHDLPAMISDGAGFHAVVDLLWASGEDEAWPDPSKIGSGPEPIGRLADVTPMDRLRVIVALASSADPLRHDLSPRSVRSAGRALITNMIHDLGPPRRSGRERRNGADAEPAAALWARLTPKRADRAKRRALEVAMALLVDHGLATSTFAARVAASVRADPYSVVVAGLGALGGPLHGAASAAVHDLYVDAERRGDAAAAVGERQRHRSQVPGFGHTLYREQDPRYHALMNEIVLAWSDDRRLQTIFRVRDVMGARSDAIPNVDLALGALTYLAGMQADAGEAVFAIARTAGWLAHAMEEYEEKPLRFRPTARYLAP